MLNYSDLIVLKYKHGASPDDGEGYTDCWLLSMEVRQRLNLRHCREYFSWVHDDYSEEELTTRKIMRWLLSKGEVLKDARPGAIFYLKGNLLAAMATVLDDGNCLFIGSSKMVIAAPLSMVMPKKFFWAD